MNTYRLNTHVYVTHDTGAGIWFGTVVNAHPAGDRIIYTIRDGNGGDHGGIEAAHMAPADTPLFPPGATVHVATDAPQHADRYGTVTDTQIRDGMLGHWVRLAVPAEMAWIPAAALAPVRIGGA